MRIARTTLTGLVAALALAVAPASARAPAPPHNVIIFVADGLRYGIVSPQSAPALAAVQREGVDFRNSHSLYPTVTTPNASVIATGHRPGDTGDFGNSAYLGAPPLAPANGSLVAFFENDPTLGAANARFGGNYLNEVSLLAAARAAGFSTAAIGKLGPAAIQDVTVRDGRGGVVIDDGSGTDKGIALAPEVAQAIAAAGLPLPPPGRGANGRTGDDKTPGTLEANRAQQDWFAAVTTKVLLPRFKAANRPFVLVYWSRDPDGTQHNQGDSLNALSPGINGPTSMAAIRNASDNLQRLRDTLKRLGLDKTTDVVVTADHGFSTVSKQSAGSAAAKLSYGDTPPGLLPPGFLAIDLSLALNLPLYETTGAPVALAAHAHPGRAGAILGADPNDPDIVLGPNGGSDLIWLPRGDRKALAARVVSFLTTQDYTGAIFVDDALGPLPGALPLSAVGLTGSAVTPRPAIVVAFRSFSTGCARPELCGADVADTELQQGQGTHGGFGRADTRNFMAAVGPSFKRRFADPAPISNADIFPTLAHILRLPFDPAGQTGRVAREALTGGGGVRSRAYTVRSTPAPSGFTTVLKGQRVGRTAYYDTAGDPARTLGAR